MSNEKTNSNAVSGRIHRLVRLESDAQTYAKELARLEKIIANKIQNHVSYFNGWKVTDAMERKDCEQAAHSIMAYLLTDNFKESNDQGDSQSPDR